MRTSRPTSKPNATVYVPENANPLKVEAIKRLGARVVPGGRSYNDAALEAFRAVAPVWRHSPESRG